jgi:hypothetical protein
MLRRHLILSASAFLLLPLPALADDPKEEKKKGGGLSFIQIQTMTTNFRRRSGAMGVMTVETGLDIPDEGLRKVANQSIPRLRAAYAQFLSSYSAGLNNGAAPNADYLALELQRQTDQVLGRPGAKFLLGTILLN